MRITNAVTYRVKGGKRAAVTCWFIVLFLILATAALLFAWTRSYGRAALHRRGASVDSTQHKPSFTSSLRYTLSPYDSNEASGVTRQRSGYTSLMTQQRPDGHRVDDNHGTDCVGGGGGDTISDITIRLRGGMVRSASTATVVNTQIHVWHQFIGAARIAMWHRALLQSWVRGEWLLATNNDGRSFGRKVVSMDSIQERRAFAQKELDARHGDMSLLFAYVKWELPRDHVIHQELRRFADSAVVREAVAAMLIDSSVPGWQGWIAGKKGEDEETGTTSTGSDRIRHAREYFVSNATLGDFFVSLYGPGDFLTSHTDDSLGSVAVVGHFALRLNLNDDNKTSSDRVGDGELSFFCADRNAFCVSLAVSSDELCTFRTQPYQVPHSVARNDDPSLLRMSFTGWFALPNERRVLVY